MKVKQPQTLEQLVQSGFRPLPIYHSYFINEEGRIYSIKYKNFLVVFPDANGYQSVTIKRKLMYVHRLIASVFLLDYKNYRYVILKDKNKNNIHLSNLQLSNILGGGQPSKPVVLNGGVISEVFPSISEVARYLNTSQTTIKNHIKNGRPYRGNIIRHATGII